MPLLTMLVIGSFAGALVGRAGGQAVHHARRKKKRLSITRPKSGNQTPGSQQSKAASISPAEAEATTQQKVALCAACLLGLGSVTVPVVGFFGLPLLVYNYISMMRKNWQSYREKKNLVLVILDALAGTVSLLLGFYFITAVLLWALSTTNRLIAKTEREARTDFSRIFGELSDTVWLLKDGVEIETSLERLGKHDVIVVYAGEMIPVDGTVFAGEGMVDQHLLTGEAQPVSKEEGDRVLTSTLLISGRLQILVEKQGAETLTGQIAKTLEHAATFKHSVQSRGQAIVEKGASRTLVGSLAVMPFVGINHAAALSYSGFGYQMRMSAPLMVLNYLRIASRNGILIKDGRALEVLHRVDTLVFDKTGTLTEEIPHVERVLACDGYTENQVLQYAASAEQRQRHPIAQAICRFAQRQGVSPLELVNTEYTIGHGLRVDLQDTRQVQHQIMIGSERFVRNAGIPIPVALERLQEQAGEKGYSIVYLANGQSRLLGALELRPTLRPQARNAVVALHALGIKQYIISGDQEPPTRHLAETLGIDDFFAETLPADKAKHVADLQAEGRKVCFIGDGINDSVALQKADVSISLHGAATIAQDTADVVLMTPDLLHLPYLIGLSTELQSRMDSSEFMNNASGWACVSGILVFGMGVSGAMALYAAGLLVNVSGAMLPLLKHRGKSVSATCPVDD